MLYYDILDEIAENNIPCETHPELHINPRYAWVETIHELIEKGQINSDKRTIMFYARYWEPLLYRKFSTLN